MCEKKKRKRAGQIQRTIPLLSWESRVPSFGRKKLFRADEIDSSMEKMFPGYLFLQQTGSGSCVRNVKTIQRISSSSWEGGDRQVGWKRKIWHFWKQVCRSKLDQLMGTFPGRGRRKESDPGGGNHRPYSQKIVKETTEKRYVLVEVGLFEDRKPFYWGSVYQEIGSGKGEDKYGRNTFDDSKDCRGRLR